MRKYGEIVRSGVALDASVIRELKPLLALQNKSLNELVNELLKAELARLKGLPVKEGEAEYEKLKKEHLKLDAEVVRLTRHLQRLGDYDELESLARELGLNFQTLENSEDVTASMLAKWDGRPSSLHVFVTLMETARQKRQLEQRLEEIRLRGSVTTHVV